MFDIKLIRDNPAAFDAGLKKRGLAPLAGALIAIDEARRKVVTRLQVVQARRNAASKEIGKAKAVRDDAAAAKLVAEVAALKAELQTGEQKQGELEQQLQAALSVIPNIPRDDVPAGFDAKDNIQVRSVGDPPRLAVDSARQHFEIGEGLQLMDFATAAKLSGARFVVLKGALARLERALGAFMLDLHTTTFGYTEVSPPLLVKDASAYGTGNLPKFADDLFAVVKDTARLEECLKRAKQLSDGELASKERAELSAAIEQGIDMATQGRLWLLPTAEVALTNFVREQIVDEGELPLRLTAYTPCFRSEAGAAGKDTRGMIRQHQFSKVELVSITTPEQSAAEHERMTECAETVLKRLRLAYRTMLLCSGDLGFASQKTYDIEVWLPGQDTYREISSCSLCGDFQARRMHARFRPKGGKDTRFPYTLNGSGLAIGRTLVAILENYQQADGSVLIPEALLPYMGGMKRIEKA